MSPKLRKIVHVILYLIAIAAGLFVGMAIFDRVMMPAFTRSKSTRKIPDLAGVSEDRAREIAEDAGFDLFVARREHSDSIPENFIISQRPAAGLPAKKGRRISVVVSLSTRTSTVPKVAGVHFRQAILTIDKAGFFACEPTYEHSDSFDKDIAIRTDPPAGSEIEIGDSVDLVVSLGSEKALVQVPNFMGQKIDDATKTGEDAGLVVIVKYRRIPTMQPKTVYRQSLDPGTRVERGSAVIVIVAQGEE